LSYVFGAIAYQIAEHELSASFSEDRDGSLISSLFAEYMSREKEEREPKESEMEAWLRARLLDVFPCAQRRPVWIESLPMWPFRQGIPMAFVDQMAVPESERARTLLSPSSELYVFGARVKSEYGWEMVYQVVQQVRGLP